MLISPKGDKYYSSFRFTFSCRNNTSEYLALIHGLQWESNKGISCLQVFRYTKLIINQVDVFIPQRIIF